MAHRTALLPDDREQVDALIARLVSDLEHRQNGRSLKDLVTSAAVSTLSDLATHGEPWATAALRALAADGARERVSIVLKQDRCLIGHNGAVVSLPSRWGVRARKAPGHPARHYQQRLWWELSWDEFEALLVSIEQQLSRLGFEFHTLREIRRLRDRYPETATPGEACERAGINPRSFERDEAVN